ncbi:PQQ-binding-like beta-propeller repeat protein [Halalkaliarchaeum sp. AArc-GB]|uniref:outer membrane protein assembly factor BamB family protein n=1 Tax=Halalkaliarchaeum sp. AArc-GB TaxID=3074078 RepID=UPI00285CAEFD|nr:PQQ-binding-like beta-propeller repeat protein [Halalkaliarchaeum sp. AArc-GB]MDR5674265.1 PQQ-binding-like beta-propeller repeat protein [Halalkaliarchaeum sp. AArc-GB]
MNRRTFLATVGVGGAALTSGCQGLAGDDRLEWRFETGGSVTSVPAVDDGMVYTGSRDRSVYAIDRFTGEKEWTFDTGGTIYNSAPVISEDTLYVGGASGSGCVHALDRDSGEEKWQFDTDGTVHDSPTIAAGTLYVGSNDGHLYAVSI